jgi:hypothetical protein
MRDRLGEMIYTQLSFYLWTVEKTLIFTSVKLQVLATTRKVARTHDPHFNSVIVHVDDIESSELTRLFKTSLKVRNGVVVVVLVLLLLVVIISQGMLEVLIFKLLGTQV